MISIQNITKSYGHVTALDGLSLQVEDGALYALVGPNGAGKTTLFRILLGLLYPDRGTVTIDGMEAGADIRRLKRRIGYVPDRIGMYPNLRVSEYMDFFADCYDLSGAKAKRQIQMLLDLVGLRDRQTQYMDTLSRGMQQKLSLARALIHDPKILILDEPIADLDPATRVEFREIIAELADAGKTMLISSRMLTEISELCTDIGILNHGKLVMEGKLHDVLDRVDASNPIIIRIAGNMSSAMQTLKKDAKVRSISIRDQQLLITYTGSPKEESALLRRLIEAGVPVQGFHREKGDLEALFLQLTGAREERRVSYYEAESDFSEG
ncbi:MAG TPA: ABC transporter ATP-binding protein [Oribacterium sp.]|nr:ABC transporter ATP-binding protein [Oribacterium sp.]HCS68164.1 ABC transporter ATP-binding protein [Oribacterium sp.]